MLVAEGVAVSIETGSVGVGVLNEIGLSSGNTAPGFAHTKNKCSVSAMFTIGKSELCE